MREAGRHRAMLSRKAPIPPCSAAGARYAELVPGPNAPAPDVKMAARTPPSASHAPPSKAARKALLGRLLKLGRPEWPRLALATLFLLIGAGAGLAFPQGMRQVIDGAMRGADTQRLDRIAIGMAIISLIFGVSIALRAYLFNTAGERVVTRLRETVYRRILDQEVGFFDSRRTGELTSRLASDTGVVQNAVSANVSMVLRACAQAAGGVVLLFLTSPLLTALMLAVVPAVAMGAVIYGRRVRRLARDVQDALAAAGRDRRGEHRRPAHRALVRRRGEGGRPLYRRCGQGIRARPQAHPGGQHASWPRPRSPSTPRRCWCSGTAAGCWPGGR